MQKQDQDFADPYPLRGEATVPGTRRDEHRREDVHYEIRSIHPVD